MTSGRFAVGHPVDVASGTLFMERVDLVLPGRPNLAWSRRYSTALLDETSSPLGRGWTSSYFATMRYHGGAFVLTVHGDAQSFPSDSRELEAGRVLRNPGTFTELYQRDAHLIARTWSVETGAVDLTVFEPIADDTWRVVAVETVSGERLELQYDDEGRLAALVESVHRRALVLGYSAAGFLDVVDLVVGRERQPVVSYHYDSEGRLIAASDAVGATDRYGYDDAGRLVLESVKDGGEFTFQFDAQGRCVFTTGRDHYDAKTLRFYPAANWTEVVDSLGAVTRYQYLNSGQVVARVDATGATTRYVYDNVGRLTSVDAGDGPTTYEYDADGNRATIRDPLGRSTHLEYDAHHLPVALTDPNGGVWRRSYDHRCRLVGGVSPLGGVWRYDYDAVSNLVSVLDPGGNELRQAFDHRGFLVARTDWVGNRSTFTRDRLGRVASRTAPNGDTTAVDYDAIGNPVAVTYGDGTSHTCEYDAARNLVAATDRNGGTTRFRYGPCNRLVELVDPMGRRTRFRWATEPGRLTAIVDPTGARHEFSYDAAGRVVEERTFDGRRLRFEYDRVGRCVRSTNGAGEVIEYSYDACRNITGKTLPSGERLEFAYDNCNSLIAAINADASLRFERDALGRITREIGDAHEVVNEYDAAGWVSRTRSSLGLDVAYVADGNGLATRVTLAGGWRCDFSRDSMALESERRVNGRLAIATSHQSHGRVHSQRWSNGEAHFSYDSGGRVIAARDASSGTTTVYDYNAADEIVRVAQGADTVKTFVRDDAGRVAGTASVSRGRAVEDAWEHGAGGAAVRRGRVSCAYDANGRLAEKRTEGDDTRRWRYAWDSLDQLREVSAPDGRRWSYAYDALGRRIGKTTDTSRTRYVWNGNALIHESEDGGVVRGWITEPGDLRPLCQLEGGATLSVLADCRGAATALLDDDGQAMWSASYDADGRATEHRETVSCDLRLVGQWRDRESGLHYNRFRYFDPDLGQYISPDPIRLAGGFHPYAYGPSLLNWIDPFGLNGCDESKRTFPDDPNELTAMLGVQPTVSTTPDGTVRMVWNPNPHTRIRYESHPGNPALPPTHPDFAPRHHGPHYHVITRTDPNVSFNNHNNATKALPPGYTPGVGTGFLPGERFPGS